MLHSITRLHRSAWRDGQPAKSAQPVGTSYCGDASINAGAVRYEDFTEVALSYLSQIRSAAHRFTRNRADADDLVQDTYQLAFAHFRDLHSLAHCRPWLHRILHRQAVTRYRRRHAGPLVVSFDSDARGAADIAPPVTRGDDLMEQISLQEIHSEIETLSPDLRATFTLCDLEGFSYAEIASLTHSPVGTVRSRISRARAKLMKRLQARAADCGIREAKPAPLA